MLASHHHFYSLLDKNDKVQGEASLALFYADVVDDQAKAKAALEKFIATIKSRPADVEGQFLVENTN